MFPEISESTINEVKRLEELSKETEPLRFEITMELFDNLIAIVQELNYQLRFNYHTTEQLNKLSRKTIDLLDRDIPGWKLYNLPWMPRR